MFVGARAARVQTTDLILTLQSLRASFPASGTPRSGVFFKPLHCGEGTNPGPSLVVEIWLQRISFPYL